MMSKQILVVDDDKDIVRLLRGYLEQAGYEVRAAYDGDTAVHMLRSDHTDVILLDLLMPGKDGWDVTRTIRSDPALSTLPIIMLTARIDDVDKIVGLELGADDYITKPFNPREVVARVKAMLRRAQMGSVAAVNPIIQVADLWVDTRQHEVCIDGRIIELTPTEYNLLQLLIENPGYAFTRAELIQKGLGYEYVGLERTIDSHIKNLRQKIEIDPSQPQYILTVYGVGYRLVDPRE